MSSRRAIIAAVVTVLILAVVLSPAFDQGLNDRQRMGTLSILGTLESAIVAAAPALDGETTDSVWSEATAITITVNGGANTAGSTQITLKSVFYEDSIYFVAQWADSQDSRDRFPWFYNTTSSQWEQKGNTTSGDDNTYYEDKLAMFWNIGDTIAGFNDDGCFVTCHVGTPSKHYTNAGGELADMWHWKRVRTGAVGQIDDQYMDNTTYNPVTAKEAGRKSDPKTAGGYSDNKVTLSYADVPSESTTIPKAWIPGAAAGTDDYYWILNGDLGVRAFNFTHVYKSNGTLIDEVGNVLESPTETAHIPGIIVSAFTGDRGNISAASKWATNQWTLEFGRKLVTGSQYDVQYENTGAAARYYFGISTFNNAQIDHSIHANVYALAFEQPNTAPGTPTIDVDSLTVRVDEVVTFSVSATDPDGDTLTYSWQFGDGATGSGASVTHSYDEAETYIVNVTASDGKGGTSTTSVTIVVEDESDAGGLSTTTLAILALAAIVLIAVAAVFLMKRKKTPPTGQH
ncbi:MAG TPA: ethylbenzene dehydrogenase-related protein [Thermoplasmata archaeon]|jgi:hypothetical protein